MSIKRYPNIDAELSRAGVTRKKLAEELGYDAPAITLKLSGRRRITLDDLRGICRVVGKPFDEETANYLLTEVEVADTPPRAETAS